MAFGAALRRAAEPTDPRSYRRPASAPAASPRTVGPHKQSALPRDDLEHLRGLGRPGTAPSKRRRGTGNTARCPAVREEQLGDREGAVLRPDLEHVAAERFAAHQHVVVQWTLLWRAVVPEVYCQKAIHPCSCADASSALSAPTRSHRRADRPPPAYDYHVREIGRRARPSSTAATSGSPAITTSPCCLSGLFVVAGLSRYWSERARRHLERPRSSTRIPGRRQQQHHPLLHPDAEPPQRVAQPVHPGIHVRSEARPRG